MTPLLIITALIIIVVIIIVAVAILVRQSDFDIIPAQKRAGIKGEEIALKIIRGVLQENDYLLHNVKIEGDGKPAELDCVVVNKFGIIIFEIKNYSGELFGSEDDYDWRQVKTTAAGNIYIKQVKNPIKQLKRQIYILSRHLDYYGRRTWIEGYVILLHQNSPFESDRIITKAADIDKAIHTKGKQLLKPEEVQKIVELLS